MGIDPLELRLINAPSEPRKQGIGGAGAVPKAREVLNLAADAIGWREPKRPSVGRGIALVDVTNSPATDYTTRLIVARDGSVELHTPIIEQGSGMLTVFRQMAADGLSVPLDRVRVVQTMENIEYDRGVGGSRITRVVGKMIGISAERMQQQLAELVAAEFGHEPSQIVIEPGGYRTPDGRVHSVAEAASLASSELVELLRYTHAAEDVVDTFEAVAVELTVDRETGQVTVCERCHALEVGKDDQPGDAPRPDRRRPDPGPRLRPDGGLELRGGPGHDHQPPRVQAADHRRRPAIRLNAPRPRACARHHPGR